MVWKTFFHCMEKPGKCFPLHGKPGFQAASGIESAPGLPLNAAVDPHPAFSGRDFAVIRDGTAGCWLRFQNPVAVVAATRIEEVLPRLREVEQAVAQRHLHAAGWVAYEAAPAFDPALAVREPGPLPLLWFGLYEKPEPIQLPPAAAALPDNWQAELSPDAYGLAFDRIKEQIRAGNTYQVNFTYRLRGRMGALDPAQAFLALVAAQRPPYGAFISAGPWRICSASPELFFRLAGPRLESRPMKGTAPRGLSSALDRAQAAALQACLKNRAENLMIVDMVRNDLGRIGRPGSVQTLALCDLEKYPTLWQLVSTVAAETDAGLADIFAALFPPASITGAPKPRTMQIIAALEPSPRQVYCGAIGFLAPGRRAQFNVAIRTLLFDARSGRAEYGTGGGIVWDSGRDAEQAECRTKARILAPPPPAFCLLETLRWAPAEGVYLLERHLQRLRESAAYFDYPLDEARLRQVIAEGVDHLPPAAHRLRLQLDAAGGVQLEAQPLAPPDGSRPWRVTRARRPVDRTDVFLYHKTTLRRVYEDAKADFPDCADVILFNADGEATESTLANLVVEIDGAWCTPPVECGLLPGTARAEFLATGRLRERRIPLALLQTAPRLFLLNSVRGLVPAILTS